MGSNYYGEQNLGGERSGGSSSRKGKKSSSDKPKQPQRGLGVAQLEKIRLHNQLGCGYIPNSLQPPYPVTNYPIQEDVRLQSAYSSSSTFAYATPSSTSYGFHGPQNMMMGLGTDMERTNIRYGDNSQTTTNIARWNAGNTILEPQLYQQPSITRRLLNLEAEELMEKKKKGGSSDSMGSGGGSQNSGSSGSQELDLELRLSI